MSDTMSEYVIITCCMPIKSRRMPEPPIGEDKELAAMLAAMPAAYIFAHEFEKMCERTVALDGMTLQYVPHELRTEELCARAVENEVGAIEFVPEKCMTVDMCRRAMKTWGRMYEKLPEAFKEDPVVKMLAVTSSPNMLERMEQTSELCELAVNSAPYALTVVKDEFKTLEMCRAAVEKEITKARQREIIRVEEKKEQANPNAKPKEPLIFPKYCKGNGWISGPPFWGIAAHIPTEYKKDETIVALLEELYTIGHFHRLGPLRISFEIHRTLSRCIHAVVDENGEYRHRMTSNEIADILERHQLRHSHHDYTLPTTSSTTSYRQLYTE